MRRYHRQQRRSPFRAQPLGCLLLMVLACGGCRSAAGVNSNACTADAAGTHTAAANGSGATAAGTNCFWNFCHLRRVPELGPTLSPFLPVPTVDVFSGMPVGVKPVAVVVPGSLNTPGSPNALNSSPPVATPPTVPPPATNAAPLPFPSGSPDREAQVPRRMLVQLASSSEVSTELPEVTAAEAAPTTSPSPSTLRIRKESLRAETAAPE